MKKNLQAVQMLLEGELYILMKAESVVRVADIVDKIEDALWIAPEYIVCMDNYKSYTEVTVCHKSSYRRINGGCSVFIQQSDHETGTIASIKCNNEILTR